MSFEAAGTCDFEDFLDEITLKLGDKETKEGIRKIFDLISENTGTITTKALERVARQLGENMTQEELKEMVDRASGNNDGYISFEDFYAIMAKRTFP